MTGKMRAGAAGQRGATGLFFALTGMMLVLFVALAVDTGRLVYAQRQLRSIADLAALDAARLTGPCSGAPTTDLGAVVAAAQAAAARRDFLGFPYDSNVATSPNSVQVGTVAPGVDNVRVFTPTGPADAQAVQVVLNHPVTKTIFLPGLYDGTVNLSATAVAQAPAVGSFTLGSSLLSVDPDVLNALLERLFGTGSGVALDAASYNGLATTDVSLGDLAAAAGVGTVDELLAMNTTLGEFVDLVATAAQRDNPDIASAVINDITIGANAGTDTTVGDLIAVDTPADSSFLDARFNVFDLVMGSALLANEDQAVAVPGLTVDAAPLASVDLTLHVTEAPQPGGGVPGRGSDGTWRAEARTSQLALELTLHAMPVSIPVGTLVFETTADVELFVQVGQASAHLASIDCGGMLSPVHQVTIGAQPGIARTGLGSPTDPADPGSAVEPAGTIIFTARDPLLGEANVAVQLGADVALAPAGAQDLGYRVDEFQPDSLPQQQTAGSSIGDSLANASSGVVSALTLDVVSVSGTGIIGTLPGLLTQLGVSDLGGALLAPTIDELMQPLLAELAPVLEDLLEALGANPGSADVRLISVDTGQPELVI